MSSPKLSNGEVATSGDPLEHLVAEIRRFNDRLEPVPWTKKPIGYALIGLALLAASVLNPIYAVAASFFFIAREINARPPHA
jgi:hypothetical protein